MRPAFLNLPSLAGEPHPLWCEGAQQPKSGRWPLANIERLLQANGKLQIKEKPAEAGFSRRGCQWGWQRMDNSGAAKMFRDNDLFPAAGALKLRRRLAGCAPPSEVENEWNYLWLSQFPCDTCDIRNFSMAVNKPPGDNARKGAVRKRSQLKTKIEGEEHWTKRDKESGEFMAQKKNREAPPYKGVWKE